MEDNSELPTILQSFDFDEEHQNLETNSSKRTKSRLIKKPLKSNSSKKKSNDGKSEEINFTDIEKIVFKHLQQPLSHEKILAVSRQVGFIPTNLVKIAYTDPDTETPIILQLYPLTYSELYGWDKPTEKDRLQFRSPFPTTFWISCPITHARVAQLEQEGWIPIINEKLFESENDLATMKRAHELYQEERWNMLSVEDKEFVEQITWADAIKNVGIAGIRDFRKVKCFHGHYAHYLARPEHNNIVGKWVHTLLTDLENSEFAKLKPQSLK